MTPNAASKLHLNTARALMAASVTLSAARPHAAVAVDSCHRDGRKLALMEPELAPTPTAAVAVASSPAQVAALAEERANQRNALLAGFLGWTLDAFDFFLLVLVL